MHCIPASLRHFIGATDRVKYGLLVPIQIQMEVSGANSALLVQVKTSASVHASPLASNPREGQTELGGDDYSVPCRRTC